MSITNISFDVLVPVYKTGSEFERLVTSIYSQSEQHPIHIIVYCTEVDQKQFNTWEKKYPDIFFLSEQKRTSKLHAINEMLKHAKSPYIILTSSDVVWDKYFLRHLVKEIEGGADIVASHPVPKSKRHKGFVQKLHQSYWQAHHFLCLQRPKFGEVIAFRNNIKSIPTISSADEEIIAALVQKNGGKAAYASKAKVYNYPPQSLKTLFFQRYRYYAGHKSLAKTLGYQSSALDVKKAMRAWLSVKNPIMLASMLTLEVCVRVCYFFFSKDSLCWT